jgi:hypothetical protein
MNLNFLKLKRDTSINPSDLHKGIRGSYDFWLISLYVFLGVVLLGAVIGGWQFYSIYTDRSILDSDVSEGENSIINIGTIDSAVRQREDFVNKPFTAPKDPS